MNDPIVATPEQIVASKAQLKEVLETARKVLELAKYEVRDWHEYNYNQIDSFENNGVNNEKDMQINVTNDIHEKLEIIKAEIVKIDAEIEALSVLPSLRNELVKYEMVSVKNIPLDEWGRFLNIKNIIEQDIDRYLTAPEGKTEKG